MSVRRAAALAAIVAATLAVAGACSKEKTPKVDGGAERAAALERAKKDVYGPQVQALEAAKALEAEANQKASSAGYN